MENRAWVPAPWRLEVANVLEMAVRRRRHKAEFRDQNLLDLGRCPIQVDPDSEKFTWSTTLQLAERYRRTLYDATYLELAKRRYLPLATLNRELRSTAPTEYVTPSWQMITLQWSL